MNIFYLRKLWHLLQVSSLKHEVDSRKKTSKDLETRIAHVEKRHRDTIVASEGTKKDLEKKHVEKVIESESMRKTVETLERKVAASSDICSTLHP